MLHLEYRAQGLSTYRSLRGGGFQHLGGKLGAVQALEVRLEHLVVLLEERRVHWGHRVWLLLRRVGNGRHGLLAKGMRVVR